MDAYIRSLAVSNLVLTEEDDSLVWEVDPGGNYSPKVGYILLSTEADQREHA